jgi:alkanesulfonate monooxygenase SsuD/methylene tetrahydromethanopterin reductase-like flavin-dependent oxidoreductase (luciferase family)
VPAPTPGGRATGLCLPHRACGADVALALAQEAERQGYESVWASELATYDAIALCAAIAATTERIRVGTAIVPVTTRTPALHAMAASTLGRLAPGRAIVGYGVSTATVIDGWHGQRLERPVAEVRDLFAITSLAFTGERVHHDGAVRASVGFRLEAPASDPPRRYLGALGPQLRRFAREHADGLLLNFAPRSALAAIVAEERLAPAYEVALPLRVAVDGVGEGAERRFRRELASYVGVGPYARWLDGLGHDDVVAAVAAGATLEERAALLPDAFVADMWASGDAAACRRTLDEVRADGVTPLVVPVIDPGDVAAFRATAAALAPAA